MENPKITRGFTSQVNFFCVYFTWYVITQQMGLGKWNLKLAALHHQDLKLQIIDFPLYAYHVQIYKFKFYHAIQFFPKTKEILEKIRSLF